MATLPHNLRNVTVVPTVSVMENFEALALKGDLSDPTSAVNGAGMVAFESSINYPEKTTGGKLKQRGSIFDYMSAALIADVKAGALTLDCTAAFNAAIASAKSIFFPPGKYRFDSTLTVTGARGLTLEGAAAALLSGGVGYAGNTEFVFDTATSGSDGLVLNDFVGVSISSILIRMRRAGAGGGRALYMYNGHDYSLDAVKVDLLVGTGGGGIILGAGNGATATFIGAIKNCKVIAGGSAGIKANFGTSLSFSACYVIGGWVELSGMTYSSANSCAVDGSTSYGYIITGCSAVTIDACGAEQSAKGAFYLSTTTTNIIFNAPYGAANNTSADASIGDLVHIDNSAGAVNSITINNPTAVAPNAATVQSIYSNSGGGLVEVNNVNATLLPRGIGGDATWIATKLTRTGDGEVQSWTPTLVGWTNSGSPTIVGTYIKRGRNVTFSVRVTPGTNISATRPASTITGLPFTNVVIGNGNMTDGNAVSYGAVAVGPTGIIFPQTTGVLTVEVNIVGTLIIG